MFCLPERIRNIVDFIKELNLFSVVWKTVIKNGVSRFVKWRWIAWGIVVACLAIIFFIGSNLQSEIAPLEDKGQIRFQISGPEGSSYEYMTTNGDAFGNYLIDSLPERSFSFMVIPGFNSTGLNGGNGRLGLIDASKRNRTQSDIAKFLEKKAMKFNNLRIIPVEEQTISVGLGSRGSLPVQFVLQNMDFEKLKSIIPLFLEEARNDKTFQNVDVNLKFNKPEADLTIDRIKARQFGLTISDIANVIQSAFSGRRLDYFIMNGKQYQVISQVALKDRTVPTDITKLYIRNNKGGKHFISKCS